MTQAAATGAETVPATVKSGKTVAITRLTVLAFMLAIIGAECLLAFIYVPSMDASGQPAASAAPADDTESPDTEAELLENNNRREVDLGHYSITALKPASNTTLLIDFRLFGTVAVNSNEESGAAGDSTAGDSDSSRNDPFSRKFDKHKHRIRDQVITIVRSAEMADFADPSLGLIRRKILEKSNRTLGKPLLEEVIFSDFSLIEQ